MKQFFKSAQRNIRRNALFSLINITGLVLGFTCLVIIAVWIKNELSYDRFHKNGDKIYRVHRFFYNPDGSVNLHLEAVAPNIGPLLKGEFSAIENIARTIYSGFVFKYQDKKIEEANSCFAEPDILKIFSFEGLPSDSGLLSRPLTAIISDHMASKFFTADDAIGKVLEISDGSGNKFPLEITGVYKQWPQNSHFNPEIFISFSTYETAVGQEELRDWSSNNYETFALIPHMPMDADHKLDAFINEQFDNGTSWNKIRFEKLTDIHFNWFSSKSYIYILTSIGLLILILGSINYMNLNAALFSMYIKDIRIKRIIGASRRNLILQLLFESVGFCVFALIIALYVSTLAIPFLNKSLGNSLVFNPLNESGLIMGLIALALITGLISGLYPLFMTAFTSVTNKITTSKNNSKNNFRNGLVVFQFVVSIALIISFALVSKQLRFLNNKELGLNKENILVIPATPLLIEKIDAFRQQLSANSDILNISASKRVPSSGLWDNSEARIISSDKSVPLDFRLPNVRADDQFLQTYKIKLLAGRDFYSNAKDSGVILNELAVKKIGWKSPDEAIGQIIEYGGRKSNVIGVAGNFHYESLRNPVSPIIIYHDPGSYNLLSIRISSDKSAETINFIEDIWQQYNNADYLFSYEYLTDSYRNLYKAEENIRSIFVYCMVLAIIIAVLGLIGLSLFLTNRRTKEIGIRKVNGARVLEIWTMLNSDFLKWVAIAYVLACPIAWYAMQQWLKGFAYKTSLSWWVFAIAGAAAFMVALLTVSWQSWRAASRNPVEALRYE